jgi:hypothetical protein
MKSIYQQINRWNKQNGNESVIFDENWNILERGKDKGRYWGNGTYSNIAFKCSKCGQLYSCYGVMRRVHKRCNLRKHKNN